MKMIGSISTGGLPDSLIYIGSGIDNLYLLVFVILFAALVLVKVRYLKK